MSTSSISGERPPWTQRMAPVRLSRLPPASVVALVPGMLDRVGVWDCGVCVCDDCDCDCDCDWLRGVAEMSRGGDMLLLESADASSEKEEEEER